MILRVPNWNEVRRSQVALGLMLLTQALLIFLARPEDASHIYEKAGATCSLSAPLTPPMTAISITFRK